MAPLALLPEISLLAGAVVALLAGSFLPQRRQWVARLVAVAALLTAGIAAALALGDPARTVFGAFVVDTPTGITRLVVVASTLLVIGLGVEELAGQVRESETYALLLLGSLGAVVLAATDDLLVLAVGFLLSSIPLYALVGLGRSARAAEAALKTYLLGALSGILLLLGCSVLFGMAGSTAYAGLATGLAGAPEAPVAVGAVGVLGGLLFKAGGVPLHFWVPDATQGAGTAAAAFLTTVPKIGALVAMIRLVDVLPGSLPWPLLLGLLAALTMTLGNLAALGQTDARRLLGWSTVSQVGYLLMPVAVVGATDAAVPALLTYLAGYAVTNLTAFAVLAGDPRTTALTDSRGLARRRPGQAAALVISLLSLVGTPPTAVFLGKLTVFTAAWDGGLAWLVVVAAVNTVISLAYYLRWLVPALSREGRPAHDGDEDDEREPDDRPWARGAAATGAVGVLAVGLGAGAVTALVAGATLG
ncbi:NADH-quinone oxidoreductase subunit N [Modestobacter roseus]|uniref:NADH-quinone oxidoreductase subunit N n=1 Tax=Modestobacter roseus TaxID=1181884 RepID=A0A562IQD7_9ACTN|nr:NADH-quinone oxidoreductase subunit N [Modestobacter roseus]MQA35617.1 NADH-quinone oxidoreductase subunit N [Modestobacter roseus]TWH73102.1 NADH-quinone oxidoreductase subunit N [Modestobacter roseus]